MLRLYEPADYEVKVQGVVDGSWSARFGDVGIQTSSERESGPVTTLSGRFPDQAALLGLLSSLYDLGLPLLSVARVSASSVSHAAEPAQANGTLAGTEPGSDDSSGSRANRGSARCG
jgi:hypothetical protein